MSMVKFLLNLTSMGKDHHIALRHVMISEVYSILKFMYVYSVFICLLYYINTNEIPGELSYKNMISSHEKIMFIFTSENIPVAMVIY